MYIGAHFLGVRGCFAPLFRPPKSGAEAPHSNFASSKNQARRHEDFDAAIQGAIVGGVADAKMRVPRAENIARDDEQIVAESPPPRTRSPCPGEL